jgi:hypothetical protein
VDWDKDKMQKKNFPSLPSNYVTLIQLKERKQRKLKEKEEEERQRMLQLQKIQEEEEERKRELQRQQEEEERKRELQRQQEEEGRKRKLERQGLKQARHKTDRKPAGHKTDHKPASHNGRKIWRRSDRVVEVRRAKPEESMAVVAVVVDIRKVSAQQEQSSDKVKEKNKNTRKKQKKKKMKPRAEEEEAKEKKREKGATDGESHALHVISEKENSPARRNGEPEGTRTEEVDRTAEIERKFGDFSIGKGNVRATRPNTGIYHGNREYRPYGGVHREYNGSGSIGGSRAVRNPSGSGMVWVRKGEIGGVRNRSSIVEPKKLE